MGEILVQCFGHNVNLRLPAWIAQIHFDVPNVEYERERGGKSKNIIRDGGKCHSPREHVTCILQFLRQVHCRISAYERCDWTDLENPGRRLSTYLSDLNDSNYRPLTMPIKVANPTPRSC